MRYEYNIVTGITEEFPDEPQEPVIEVPSIPQVVSRAQGLVTLEMAGLLELIETYMQTAARLEQIAWGNIQQFERTSPLLNQLLTTFGLSSEDADTLFINASQVII